MRQPAPSGSVRRNASYRPVEGEIVHYARRADRPALRVYRHKHMILLALFILAGLVVSVVVHSCI